MKPGGLERAADAGARIFELEPGAARNGAMESVRGLAVLMVLLSLLFPERSKLPTERGEAWLFYAGNLLLAGLVPLPAGLLSSHARSSALISADSSY
jgi:hypothetical protein